MALSKQDREFRLSQISYLHFKRLAMDRVLIAFFARLHHRGFPHRLLRKTELTTDAFVEKFLDQPEWFRGFASHPEILRRWIETQLMDMVNRGKPNQAIAAPRPLHGITYRFRNPKRSLDYGASQHLYEMLHGARDGKGDQAIEQLRRFFFQGYDPVTGRVTRDVPLDVETRALMRLLDHVDDRPDTTARVCHPPLCVGAADLLAADVMRLLCYQHFVPRSVMVDYVKVLFSFHLALYHLRLLKLLPALLQQKEAGSNLTHCAQCTLDRQRPETSLSETDSGETQASCPYQVGLLVDLTAQSDSHMAVSAQQSADTHFRRIPAFVKAYFTTKKLHEFALSLVQRAKLPHPATGHFRVEEIWHCLEPTYTAERNSFFQQRVSRLVQDGSEEGNGGLDPAIEAATTMGLDAFGTYIEILMALRGPSHRTEIAACIDSLLLKNRPGALVAQSGTRAMSSRRFILDSRLLEVLLQLAVLRPGGRLGYHSRELRVDELSAFLRKRYGLYIDRLPGDDGFRDPSITDHKALRSNLQAFTSRLRKIGFYHDLSDAYLTQTITPRYQVGPDGETATHTASRGEI